MELPDDDKPADAHIALNVIEDDDGNELKIVRDNMPFGRVGDRRVRHVLHRLRRRSRRSPSGCCTNMFLGDPPGTTDRILDFSTARTGCLFFVPSQDWLDAL